LGTLLLQALNPDPTNLQIVYTWHRYSAQEKNILIPVGELECMIVLNENGRFISGNTNVTKPKSANNRKAPNISSFHRQLKIAQLLLFHTEY
jgi:hypothetical protein